jgi:hypothetical protein
MPARSLISAIKAAWETSKPSAPTVASTFISASRQIVSLRAASRKLVALPAQAERLVGESLKIRYILRFDQTTLRHQVIW